MENDENPVSRPKMRSDRGDNPGTIVPNSAGTIVPVPKIGSQRLAGHPSASAANPTSGPEAEKARAGPFSAVPTLINNTSRGIDIRHIHRDESPARHATGRLSRTCPTRRSRPLRSSPAWT